MHAHRTWLERSLSALFAVWLAFVVAEPASLHSCPMHGGHGAAAASLAARGLDTGAREHHAFTAEHEHGAPEPGAPADRDGQRYCNCLGECSTGGTGAAIPGTAVQLIDVVVQQAPSALPPAATRVDSGTEHLLPFANGPPRA